VWLNTTHFDEGASEQAVPSAADISDATYEFIILWLITFIMVNFTLESNRSWEISDRGHCTWVAIPFDHPIEKTHRPCVAVSKFESVGTQIYGVNTSFCEAGAQTELLESVSSPVVLGKSDAGSGVRDSVVNQDKWREFVVFFEQCAFVTAYQEKLEEYKSICESFWVHWNCLDHLRRQTLVYANWSVEYRRKTLLYFRKRCPPRCEWQSDRDKRLSRKEHVATPVVHEVSVREELHGNCEGPGNVCEWGETETENNWVSRTVQDVCGKWGQDYWGPVCESVRASDTEDEWETDSEGDCDSKGEPDEFWNGVVETNTMQQQQTEELVATPTEDILKMQNGKVWLRKHVIVLLSSRAVILRR